MNENKEMGFGKEYTIDGEKVTLVPLSADYAHLAFDLGDEKKRSETMTALIKETFKASGLDFSKYRLSAVADATNAVLDINGLNKE